MLADSIRHAFGLHLTGAAVWPVSLFDGWGVLVDGMELGMGDLMDGRFQGLDVYKRQGTSFVPGIRLPITI